MSNKGMTISSVEGQLEQQQTNLELQSKLRQAIFGAISEHDVEEIIKRQVEKAKQGDNASLQFVMKYVLGFGQPVTLNQINVMDVETAARIANRK